MSDRSPAQEPVGASPETRSCRPFSGTCANFVLGARRLKRPFITSEKARRVLHHAVYRSIRGVQRKKFTTKALFCAEEQRKTSSPKTMGDGLQNQNRSGQEAAGLVFLHETAEVHCKKTPLVFL
uniref:Uncharacterized protein n=1 Tax=Steinernema glaseri TaxID=37863 RepID=A0A1I7ZRS5_9BILA